ncbi:unnamed protein product [Adineta steineri]|uniref:Potassium channel tetramerisation-type BTB domain-containing protein n=1 Tax=Adineta steineri TaxID=433720 RepID=A0A819CS98_9BILA|nr:unnamed protein product [Adineta steineri]CAF3820480.1 unnamed protein product [Adineta steineri]CAF3905117.1 unnamed protein product [Adineta steineri]
MNTYPKLFIYLYIFLTIINIINSTESITEENITNDSDQTDVIQLNVGGELIMTTRSTLTCITNSTLAIIFNDRWENILSRDKHGNIFLDFNPVLFHHLLEQLRLIENNESILFYPPLLSSLIIPYEKMLRKLGLNQLNKPNDIIQLNVGGEILTTRQKILNQITNYTTNLFIDSNPYEIRQLVNQLREQDEIEIVTETTTFAPETTSFFTTFTPETTSYSTMLSPETTSFSATFIPETTFSSTTLSPETTSFSATFIPKPSKPMITTSEYDDGICANATWNPYGITVAGGNGQGSELNQLNHPMGIFIDENSSIYVADTHNNRISKWILGASQGEIVVGANNSKNYVSSVVVDKNQTIYLCDRFNNRIVRWLKNALMEEVILSNISCWGLALDKEGSLYISGHEDNRIIKWPAKEIVAGGNGEGNQNDQLSSPYQIFIDNKQTIYIADYFNHRIMKWFNDDLQEGLIVAGGNGYGDGLDQLKLPHSVVVDQMGTMYIVDFGNNRILRWFKHSKSGRILIGNDESGNDANQLSDPYDIAFDREGNLYVADTSNHRIQMYRIDKSACTTNEL